MRFVESSGLWTSSALDQPPPLVAVLELGGAVLSWIVDDPSAPAEIALTDAGSADWLWRLFGEPGHQTLAAALAGDENGRSIDLTGVEADPEALAPLRRLALGHWLRRWWPASRRDGIAALDGALLDAEVALLTVAVQDFFSEDTLDSDVGQLLATRAAELGALEQGGDPRVVAICRSCAELADDIGVAAQPETAALAHRARRDDYALAAGVDSSRDAPAVARGVDSVRWAAVPPGMFDAAEDTVDWRVEVRDPLVTAIVRVDSSEANAPTGIPVRMVSGSIGGSGTLTAEGTATLALEGSSGEPVTPAAAWNHDWRATAVTIGAGVEESARTRRRVRDMARARLDHPGPDAYLAEIIAGESDY